MSAFSTPRQGQRYPVQTDGAALPDVFTRNEALELSSNLLRPFGGKNLKLQKKTFSRRVCPARRYGDRTFGTVTRRWRIFHRSLSVKLIAPRIIKKYEYCYIILCVKEMVVVLTT
jgi:hypothetical protein